MAQPCYALKEHLAHPLLTLHHPHRQWPKEEQFSFNLFEYILFSDQKYSFLENKMLYLYNQAVDSTPLNVSVVLSHQCTTDPFLKVAEKYPKCYLIEMLDYLVPRGS